MGAVEIHEIESEVQRSTFIINHRSNVRSLNVQTLLGLTAYCAVLAEYICHIKESPPWIVLPELGRNYK